MSYFISEDCISCSACEPECPNKAISEGAGIFVINPEKCSECVGSFKSSRCADVCPVDACHPDPKHVEDKGTLLKRWQGIHPSEKPKEGTY